MGMMDVTRQRARVNPMRGDGDGLGEVHIADLFPLSLWERGRGGWSFPVPHARQQVIFENELMVKRGADVQQDKQG